MAKNLKLNIKNAQLAEALKLGKVSKPAAKKKEAASSPPPPAKEAAAPVEQPKVDAPLPPLEAKVESSPRQEVAPPVNKPAEPSAVSATPPKVEQPSKQPPSSGSEEQPPSSYRPPYQQREYRPAGDRPPYPPRDNRPQGDRPPYQQREYRPAGDRPPYPPRDNRPPGDRPPYQQREYRPAGDRPPYPPRDNRPPGDRPPYQQREYRPAGSAPSSAYQQTRPGGDRPAPHFQRPGDRPTAYRPAQRPYSPRPPQSPPPSPLPNRGADKPGARPYQAPGPEAQRKTGPGFKDYRDIKPQRKADQRSFDTRDRQGLRDTDDEAWRKRRPAQKGRSFYEEEVIRPKNLTVRVPISIKDLASEMKLKASQLISKLFMQGVVVTLNDLLDDETTIQLLGHEFDCELKIDTREEERLRITEKTIKEEIQETQTEEVKLRPPVVTFMGHVDHGKTSLIDAIRKSDIAGGEAGAITQHIGAFKCHTAVGDICILDTPGHEAFSAMRARGADVTDIVVLVIAGDEGIRTQTLEAMEQAKAANVPIVVAINKSDKPNFDLDNIYRQLADNNLLPESWGGTIITVSCSAVTGAGIKELLEMLALQAEILELRANPANRARGTVIESEMHKGLGGVATVLVQTGTLRLGDAIVFAQHWARVKTMHDEHGKELSEAGPSSPVKITGLSGLPEAGSEFIVVKNEKEARELSHGRVLGQKQRSLQQTKRTGLEGLLQQKADSVDKKVLTLILKADVQGSLEALKNSLNKILSTKVEINIISAEVGEVSESDIQLAAASKAVIIGFHTGIESHAEQLIKQLKVTVKLHDIIYHAVDDIRAIMKTLLDKIPQETDTGSALVKTVFKSSHLGLIAGCQVIEGTIHRNNQVRVVRNKQVIWKGPIASLKRVKEDVKEISKGYECGILLNNNTDIKEEDILQAFEITYLEQEI